ncbi:hypothetical protein [Flavobacterium sp.]|uniref:hypothetical protein n=1 Tax=Flavobacterium sp. TaxID=239 RepID=UPI002B4B5C4E|nr:hypothetical protein [Flavobacterium sp.]HLP65193.1 hypothetical protein [Flavobacterium sp.]
MNKLIIQILLILCVIIEGILLLKAFMITDVIHNALYSGLAILMMLTIFRLLNYLTNNIYGND